MTGGINDKPHDTLEGIWTFDVAHEITPDEIMVVVERKTTWGFQMVLLRRLLVERNSLLVRWGAECQCWMAADSTMNRVLMSRGIPASGKLDEFTQKKTLANSSQTQVLVAESGGLQDSQSDRERVLHSLFPWVGGTLDCLNQIICIKNQH
jgi:hypothetical protein